MTLRNRLVSQFHHPRGVLGRLAGAIMAWRPSNRARNLWTVDLLDVRPGQRVLELGPGPGVTVAELLARVGDGKVTAIDHSRLMLNRCRRRHRRAIREGRLVLIEAEFPGVSDGDVFDRILAVNSLQFDAMTEVTFARLRSSLVAGGRLAVTFQPRGAGATADDATRFGERAARLLDSLRFVNMRIERLALEPVDAVCVLGETV